MFEREIWRSDFIFHPRISIGEGRVGEGGVRRCDVILSKPKEKLIRV